MTVSLFINQVACAAAALGLVLASHQGALAPAPQLRASSGAAIHAEAPAPAVQTVNRAAKGDKWTILPEAAPEEAATPDEPRSPVVIAGRYEVVAAMLASAERSITGAVLALRNSPEVRG